MEHLSLARPIVFFDLETTGISLTADRIVEITVLKVSADGSETFISHLVNPGIPIPPKATAIHQITDADVEGKPHFKQYAKSLADFFQDCDIGGYNIKKFDLPMLEAEFKRAGMSFSRTGRAVVDAMVIFHKNEPRDLKAAFKKYCGKDLVDGHRAEADVRATIDILEAQLSVYRHVPRDIDGLHRYCCFEDENEWVDLEGKLVWSDRAVLFNFGSHKGESLNSVAVNFPDYLRWIIDKDFSDELKMILADALSGMFPER